MAKNLLFVLDTLALGGAEQSVVNMVPELTKRGHHCFFVALSPPVQVTEALQRDGVSVSTLIGNDLLVDGPHLPELVWKLAAFIRRHSIDVVQAYGYWSPIVVALT